MRKWKIVALAVLVLGLSATVVEAVIPAIRVNGVQIDTNAASPITSTKLGVWAKTADSLPYWRQASGSDLPFGMGGTGSSIQSTNANDSSKITDGAVSWDAGRQTSVFRKIEPNEAGSSKWYEGLNAALFFGTRLDQVITTGWNLATNGTRYDAANIAIGDQWESYYAQDATHIWAERHMVFIDTNSNYYRPMSWKIGQTTGGSTVGGYVTGYFSADEFAFNDSNPAGTTTHFWYYMPAGSGTLYLQQTTTSIRQQNNNTKWLYQINAAANNYYSLLKLNASDQVEIGTGSTSGGDSAGILLGSRANLASGIDLVAVGGVTDFDFSASSGFWKGPTGIYTYASATHNYTSTSSPVLLTSNTANGGGWVLNTANTFTGGANVFTVKNNGTAGFYVDSGGAVFSGGNFYDGGAAATLNIGPAVATSVTLGSATIPTIVSGNISVASAKTLTPAADNNSAFGDLTHRWKGVFNSAALSGGYRSASSTVTIATTDWFVGVSGTGARTVNLPAANTFAAGQELVVQEIGADVGTITINRAGADTINGATTATISAAYGRLVLMSDGSTKWFKF